MKTIEFRNLKRKRMKKNIFMLLILSIFMLFVGKSYSQDSKLRNKLNNFSICSKTITEVKYDKIVVNNLEDIYKKRDGLYVFSNVNIDLRNLPVEKRKDVFIRLLLPSIQVVQHEILNNREIVKKLKAKKELNETEKKYATMIFNKYKIPYGNWDELQSKMIIYPTSLILSQGAIESAWGTSRFFREGNNAFGIWSANPNEPRIPAKGSRGDFVPHLRRYNSLKDTVEDITLVISRSPAYSNARKMIWEGKSSYEIAGGLLQYSEEGYNYIKKIRNTLNHNNFEKYDV